MTVINLPQNFWLHATNTYYKKGIYFYNFLAQECEGSTESSYKKSPYNFFCHIFIRNTKCNS